MRTCILYIWSFYTYSQISRIISVYVSWYLHTYIFCYYGSTWTFPISSNLFPFHVSPHFVKMRRCHFQSYCVCVQVISIVVWTGVISIEVGLAYLKYRPLCRAEIGYTEYDYFEMETLCRIDVGFYFRR